MSQEVVLKSFEELASLFPSDNVEPECPSDDDGCRSNRADGGAATLIDLCRQLEEAGLALTRIVVRDQQERERAAQDLERYDALVRQRNEAEEARARAKGIRREAEAFLELAYGEEARAEAERIGEIARHAEEIARSQVERWRADAERLAAELNLERLLAARRREEEREKEKAAAVERTRRVGETLARARTALAAGHLADALGLLDRLDARDADEPEVVALKQEMGQRELAIRVAAAEEALREARRSYRRDPLGVATRLAALDLAGLPFDLRRQVFGEWARACSRLCRDRGLVSPLRYAPDPGRGAVIARERADGKYVVVSALGMGVAWREGEVVDEDRVRRSRPLR